MTNAITKTYNVNVQQLNTVADLSNVIDAALNANYNLDFNAFREPPVDEVQRISLSGADGGTWTWTWGTQPTNPIAWNASTSAVQSALEALPNIEVGDVSVTGGAGSWLVTFTGNLAGNNVGQADVNGSALIGSAPLVTSQTVTQGRAARKLYTLLISRNGRDPIQPLNQAAPPFGRFLVWDNNQLLDLSQIQFDSRYTIV